MHPASHVMPTAAPLEAAELWGAGAEAPCRRRPRGAPSSSHALVCSRARCGSPLSSTTAVVRNWPSDMTNTTVFSQLRLHSGELDSAQAKQLAPPRAPGPGSNRTYHGCRASSASAATCEEERTRACGCASSAGRCWRVCACYNATAAPSTRACKRARMGTPERRGAATRGSFCKGR